MKGTLPDAIGLWENITAFSIYTNEISGTVPVSVSGWKEVKQFQPFSNHLSGGALPDLPFEQMMTCSLFFDRNSFDCPWPHGVTANCKKYDTSGMLHPVAPADCTGYSCNAATGQCEVDPKSTQPPSACIATCKEPTKYRCDTIVGHCSVDPLGTQTAQDCIQTCTQAPTPKPTTAPTPAPGARSPAAVILGVACAFLGAALLFVLRRKHHKSGVHGRHYSPPSDLEAPLLGTAPVALARSSDAQQQLLASQQRLAEARSGTSPARIAAAEAEVAEARAALAAEDAAASKAAAAAAAAAARVAMAQEEAAASAAAAAAAAAAHAAATSAAAAAIAAKHEADEASRRPQVFTEAQTRRQARGLWHGAPAARAAQRRHAPLDADCHRIEAVHPTRVQHGAGIGQDRHVRVWRGAARAADGQTALEHGHRRVPACRALAGRGGSAAAAAAAARPARVRVAAGEGARASGHRQEVP